MKSIIIGVGEASGENRGMGISADRSWIDALPWWRKDNLGWPIVTYKGKPFKSALRILFQNIRKITG